MWSHVNAKLVFAASMIAALGIPSSSHACGLFDWLCGRSRGAPVAQTTYAPPYCGPTAIPSAAAVSYASPMTACPAPVVACPTQTCYYVQETRYRAPSRPILNALFGPRVEVDPCTGCTVTTYRPIASALFGLRPVPHTTYRQVCSPAYAPAVSYSPVSSYAPTSYSPVSTFAPAVGTVMPGCPSCGSAAPPAQTYVAPGPAAYGVPEVAEPNRVVPQTFAPQELHPQPQPEPRESLMPLLDPNTKLNREPAPLLVDPESRTTGRPVRQAVYRPDTASSGPKLVEVQWKPASR